MKNYKILRGTLVLLLSLALGTTFAQPPGWDYVNTGQNHSILANEAAPFNATILVDGNPIAVGDYIGVFFLADDLVTEVCGGYGEWGTTIAGAIQFAAWGDDVDTPVKDGFLAGEEFIFRVYQAATSTECTDVQNVQFTVFGPFTNDLTYTLNGNTNVTNLEATCGAPPTDNTWTGAFDNDWFEPLNWSMGTVPVAEDVIIPVTAKGNPVILNGSATTGALTVTAGAGLAVDFTGDLTTNGLFTCDGDFEIYTESGSGYAGSFIGPGGLDPLSSGMFYFTRNMLCTGSDPSWDENPFGWHYLGAVIDGLSTDDMLDYYVNEWDEVGDSFMNYAGTQPCIPYAPAEFLDGMEAWSINYDSEWPYTGVPGGPCAGGTGLDIEFSGPFTAMHDGAYSAGATVSGGTYSGWNMFANPYPSGLDMNAIVWDVPNVIPGAAYWDGCVGLANSYVTWSPALGAYSMSPGLGFFTEWTAPGTFSVSNADRAHGADVFWKDEITSLLTLQVNMGEEAGDVTHVRFMEEAQAGFAPDGDFHKLMDASAPNLYTTAGADQLAINALPATNMVPMGFTAASSGEYTIEAIETSEFNEVYLQDLVTGDVTDLMTSDYTFDYTTGEDANRFIIHFSPVGIGENLMDGVSIWSSENSIYVSVPKELKGTIAVYNMMGQEVVSTDTQPGTNVIPMHNTNTYYVVKVLSSTNAVTGKVYIK